MGFRFTLATVLRLREIAEEREERLLGQILHQIAQTRQMLADLQAQQIRLLQRREIDLQTLTSAAELHVSYGQLHDLEDRQKNVHQQLVKLDALREQQMKVYEAAHRGRELLAGMRQEHLEQFRYKQNRAEQSAMDDNFISRRSLE